MYEVEVISTPANLAILMGLGDDAVFDGRAQVRGSSTVYRTIADTAPDPAAIRGYRHPVGDQFRVRLFGTGTWPQWVWTASGTATLVIESGA